MKQNSYLETVLSYFISMDIDNLRLYLKDEYSYQDTTKEIFLNEIEDVFMAYKYSCDIELLIYKGACGSQTCDNCGVKGYRFVANHSKNYMDLLFVMVGNDIKDIYNCEKFKTDVEIDNLGIKADIDINSDDQIACNWISCKQI